MNSALPATEETGVLLLRVRNPRAEAVEFAFEPWGFACRMPAGATFVLAMRGAGAGPIVEAGERRITIHAAPGAVARIFHDGVEIADLCLPLALLPPALRAADREAGPWVEIRHRASGRVIWRVPGESLRGADLRRAPLQGADLRGVDLREANLQIATLIDADLRGADLRGARLGGAYLLRAHYDAETRWPRFFQPGWSGANKQPLGNEVLPAAAPEGRGEEALPADPEEGSECPAAAPSRSSPSRQG
jgi:hypothetical protein